MDSIRPLTEAETRLARSVFGAAIDYDRVRIANRKFIFFQPAKTVMAPMGTIHFHPKGHHYCDDFAAAGIEAQGLFIHEMTHVWQYQSGIFLPIKRHPFCRYEYALHAGWELKRYGLEQQAEIVSHAFMLRSGAILRGAPPLAQFETILPFKREPLPKK